ncbi:PaaI family thioesterase [Halioxenophilus aromaticivorans]|uniref:Thioesterase domain-containing protein n=1 Tax=Halioxenophilus aromaticivorans TaxID=1306992 RepID=A0AAV3U9P5_9ALTE
MAAQPPLGFGLLDCTHLPFNHLTGPIYIKEGDSTPRFGMFILPQHSDAEGFAERGVLATLADMVAGRSLVIASNFTLGCFTISLNLEFLAPVPQGGWIETTAKLYGQQGNVAFVACDISYDGNVVMQANGKFKQFPHADLR